MKLPIIYENIATPKRSITEHIILSSSLYGRKSPKPTVDKDVNEK